MGRAACAAFAVALAPAACRAHGHITWPPSRMGGALERGGQCAGIEGAGALADGACLWFSQPAEIPGEPTVNAPAFRTYNVNVSSGPRDWSRKMPWRAPGTAPVFGSGCGSAGGGPVSMPNGGTPPNGVPQGFDGARLPAGNRTVWQRGEVAEVAHAIFANHGGGYSWRLCRDGAGVSEDCFQRTVLRFAGDKQWVQYAPWVSPYGAVTVLPRYEIPLTRVAEGTYPAGSEWARNPMPGCLMCDQADCDNATWADQQHCAQQCSGLWLPMTSCPPGMTQFPELLRGISGYDWNYPGASGAGFPWSIVDKVVIPRDIEPGNYLLSWRWDCEQSRQIWQNCADVQVV